jgi:outer membrane protein TolC
MNPFSHKIIGIHNKFIIFTLNINVLMEKNMKRILIALILILIIFVNSSKSVFAEGHDNNIIDKLIEEAVNNNPELKIFEEKIQVFKERPSQARSLDDPRLRLSIMNLPVDTFRFDQAPMTQKKISIMQKFPFPGKLTLKSEMAEKELEIVKEEYVDKKNNIIMKVKVVYQNILFIYNAIEITEGNRGLLKEFVEIAETKYTVGKGIQQDVLKAQVELSKMIDRLIVLEQKRQTAVARLNTLLNRPTQMPFTDIGQIKQTSFNLTFEELQKIAEEERPVLIGLRHLIERYRFAYKLAEKDYYPDFDFVIGYGQRDDSLTVERSDFLSGSIMLNIPIWYKTKESRKVAEEKANMRKTTEQYNSMKNEIFFQIKDILTEIERYNQEIELFDTGLIPQSTLSLESAIAGYKVNKVDFITLVNNQMLERDFFKNAMCRY